MVLKLDVPNSRVILELTPQELKQFQLLVKKDLDGLENYASNYLTNAIGQHKERLRETILQRIKAADETKLADVVGLLETP